MGKVINSTSMTADGLVEVSDWFVAEGDHERAAFKVFDDCEAILLGRKTYEGLAEYWPTAEGPWADRINPMQKYVASRSLSGEQPWNATVLDGDAASSVARLKDEVQGDIFQSGCGELAEDLFDAGLIDEIYLWVHPSFGGDGARPFIGGKGIRRLDLLESNQFASGVTLLRYAPSA